MAGQPRQTTVLFPKLPDYVQPLPDHVGIHDLGKLNELGALQIPRSELRDDLIHSFLDYANITMPIFDSSEVLGYFKAHTDTNTANLEDNQKISHVLLQAMLFVGSAFCSTATIQALGFNNRNGARKQFYLRTRTLYDLQLEHDPVVVCQVLVLLTHWVEVEDERGPWHWMGAAVSQLQDLTIRDVLKAESTTRQHRKTLKRLWWSCFNRDTTLALGRRYTSHFRPTDISIELLSDQDFEQCEHRIDDSGQTMESGSCPGHDRCAKYSIQASLSVAFTRVFVEINRILCAASTVRTVLNSGFCLLKTSVAGDQWSVMAHEVQHCASRLQSHEQSLQHLMYYPSNNGAPGQREHESISLHRLLLQISLVSAENCLYRPQILPADNEYEFAPVVDSRLHKHYRRRLFAATERTSQLFERVLSLGLQDYLPSFSISFLIPVVMVQLVQLRVCRPRLRAKLVKDYSQVMKAMDVLRDRYTCAEHTMVYIGTDLLQPMIEESRKQSLDTGFSTDDSSSPHTSPLQASPTIDDEPPAQPESMPTRTVDNRSTDAAGVDALHFGVLTAMELPQNASSDQVFFALNQEKITQPQGIPSLPSGDISFDMPPTGPSHKLGKGQDEYQVSEADRNILAMLRYGSEDDMLSFHPQEMDFDSTSYYEAWFHEPVESMIF